MKKIHVSHFHMHSDAEKTKPPHSHTLENTKLSLELKVRMMHDQYVNCFQGELEVPKPHSSSDY